VRFLATAAAVIALVGPATAVAAEARAYLEVARADLDNMRFDRALESLDAALRAGDSDPRQLAEIYDLLGRVTASLGLADAAVGHFQRLLTLRPDASLPEGVSPKIAAPFADASAALRGRPPLRMHHELSGGAAPALAAIIDSDPLSLVAGVRADFQGPGVSADAVDHVEVRGRGRLPIPLPRDARRVSLAAVDRYGNHLVELQLELAPAVEAAPAPTRRKRPTYARWFVWGSVGLATALAGAIVGGVSLATQNDLQQVIANSPDHDYREARSLADNARAEAIAADTSFAVAGVFVIVAAALLAVERK
jgi:tetratricopeptide (TPR) repeat protein